MSLFINTKATNVTSASETSETKKPNFNILKGEFCHLLFSIFLSSTTGLMGDRGDAGLTGMRIR